MPVRISMCQAGRFSGGLRNTHIRGAHFKKNLSDLAG